MGGKALLGKTALVTGASQSIGLASASLLAQDGATIVVMGRGAGGLERARDALRESAPGSRVEAFVGDACDEEQIKAALKYAKGISGTLDILRLLLRRLAGTRAPESGNTTRATRWNGSLIKKALPRRAAHFDTTASTTRQAATCADPSTPIARARSTSRPRSRSTGATTTSKLPMPWLVRVMTTTR